MKHVLQITSVAVFILFAAISEAGTNLRPLSQVAKGINLNLKMYQK